MFDFWNVFLIARRFSQFLRVPPYEILVVLTNFFFSCWNKIISWGTKHTTLFQTHMYLLGHESGFPDFGRSCMPNYWGITVQTSNVEGRWHRNWARNRPPKFFLQTDMKIVKNKIFFLFRLLVGNNKEICDESKKVKRPIKIGEQTPLGRKFAARQFWPCFGRPKLVEGSRFPCCVLLALSWNTNENQSTDKLSRTIN